MAYFKSKTQYKLTTADSGVEPISERKLLKNSIGGCSDIMIRNFYLHGYTCSELMKSEF